MLIRVVTKEVRYIHEISLTLEHSMPISSPTASGLTAGAGFLCLRQLQNAPAPGTQEHGSGYPDQVLVALDQLLILVVWVLAVSAGTILAAALSLPWSAAGCSVASLLIPTS